MIERARDHLGFPIDIWNLQWLEPGEWRFDWSKDKLTPEQDRTLANIEVIPRGHPLRRRLELIMDVGLWPPPPDDQAGT